MTKLTLLEKVINAVKDWLGNLYSYRSDVFLEQAVELGDVLTLIDWARNKYPANKGVFELCDRIGKAVHEEVCAEEIKNG